MKALATTLQELATFFGLPSLSLNARGEVAVRIGAEDDFLLELHGNRLFVSVARPLPAYTANAPEKALRLCCAGAGPLVRAGLSATNRLVFTTTLTVHEVSPQELLYTLDTLLTLQNAVSN